MRERASEGERKREGGEGGKERRMKSQETILKQKVTEFDSLYAPCHTTFVSILYSSTKGVQRILQFNKRRIIVGASLPPIIRCCLNNKNSILDTQQLHYKRVPCDVFEHTTFFPDSQLKNLNGSQVNSVCIESD